MRYLILVLLFVGNLLAVDFEIYVTKKYIDNHFDWKMSDHYDYAHSLLKYKSSNFAYELTGRVDVWKLFLRGNTNFDFRCLGGEGNDTDYINNITYYKSIFDVKTDIEDVQLDLGYKLLDNFYIFAFHKWYKATHLMENGVLVIDLYPTNLEYGGMKSTYSINYHQIGWGAELKTKIIKRLDTEFTMKHIPNFNINGNGYWNLRDLRFKHKGGAELVYSNILASVDLGAGLKARGGFYFEWLWSIYPRRNQFAENIDSYIDWNAENFSRGFWFGFSMKIF